MDTIQSPEISDEQKSFAAELGIPLITPQETPPADTPVEGAAPVVAEAGSVEAEFLQLSTPETPQADTPQAPEVDEEVLQQSRFRKSTGISNYQVYQKVMAADTSVKDPVAQLDLLLTLEEIEGKEALTPEERDILKSRKQKQFGLDEDATESDKVYGGLQLRKEFNAALAKLSEIQASVKGNQQAPTAPVADNSVRELVMASVKEPLSISIKDEGVDFNYVPEAKIAAKYYAEIVEHAKAGVKITGDDPKKTIRDYVTMRIMQEHGQDAIKAAIKYGKELQLKETSSGRYTPQREVNAPTREGLTPEQNVNAFLGL
jgi:hypothetical protein